MAEKMRLLLLGCTGFVGRELVPQLLRANHHVTLVSRNSFFSKELSPRSGLDFIQKDPSEPLNWEDGPLYQALSECDGVVNLAGEPIAERRWTKTHLQLIESSRVLTTNSLVTAMHKLDIPPKVLVNASAIGFYGTSIDCHFNESSLPGNDFLARLCKRWEELAGAKPSQTRLVVMRIGIVLESDGGALGKMLPFFRAGFGGPIGTGQQWMSWIHRSDLCELIVSAITDDSWQGVFNAVAPKPVSMSSFAYSLGKVLGRPSLLPVPGPILKVLLGDGARVVLEGQYVTSERLFEKGFAFKYADLINALYASIK